jgi:hypothetical protein
VLRAVLAAVLLAGVTFFVTASVSKASVGGQQSQQCQSSSSAQPSCRFDSEIELPLTVTISAQANPENGQSATVTWSIDCTVNGASPASSNGSYTAATPLHTTLTLPKSESGDCTVDAGITASGFGQVTGTLTYTPGVQVMMSVPTHDTNAGAPMATFMCMTDAKQGHTPGAAVVLSGCSYLYVGAWTYNGEYLEHGGLCLTDPRNGWIRTKLTLDRCTGAADQTWTYHAGGQSSAPLSLKSNGLCLDDPKYSEQVGTQMIVFSCNGTPEQAWAFSS